MPIADGVYGLPSESVNRIREPFSGEAGRARPLRPGDSSFQQAALRTQRALTSATAVRHAALMSTTGETSRLTTITSWARLVWEGLASCDLDADTVFREVGLDPAALTNPSARYPVLSMARLWRVAEERSGDPCFGLRAASFWHPTTWSALGYSWLASATLEEAMQRLARYSKMISDAAQISFKAQHDRSSLTIMPSHPQLDPPGVVMDTVLATVIHMCRVSYGQGFNPVRVDFTHEGRGCRQERESFFAAPVHYSARENSLRFSRAQVSKPLATANAVLARTNDRVIADYLTRLGGETTVMRVKAKLIDRLPSGAVTQEEIAEILHMSLRTLQRKLGEEDTTYKRVLEETRRELAERYIEDASLTLSEITYLLGFSDASSFSRSFKRWTGVAPSLFRDSR